MTPASGICGRFGADVLNRSHSRLVTGVQLLVQLESKLRAFEA